MSIRAAVSPPVELEVDDKTYKFSRVTPMILAEFEDYVCGKTGDQSPKPFTETLQYAQTMDGMGWIIWRCRTEHDADAKRTDVLRLIPSIDIMSTLFAQVMDMGNFGSAMGVEDESALPSMK